MKIDCQLPSKDGMTKLVKDAGVTSWSELAEFVKNLPYGRNSNRKDFGLVVKEGRGTCSSKHAFLKKIADLNEIQGVSLMLGIYKMTQANTPKIRNVLRENELEYVPEAHCYLKVDACYIDLTSSSADFNLIKADVMEEFEIEPEQVGDFKVNYHKSFVQNWMKKEGISMTFEEVWEIREQCIINLTKE